MKVYSADESLQKPEIDYTNYDFKKTQAENDAYIERIKNWLINDMGYTGPNTGRMLETPFADGAALYMFAESENKRKSFLIHLDIGDGWHNPLVEGLTKKAVLDNIDRNERFKKMWNSL